MSDGAFESFQAQTHRDSLSKQIADRITEKILGHDYKPGSVLPSENALSREYAVSRPVVREALKILAAQGLVEIRSGRSALVQEPNDSLLRSFFRRMLIKQDPTALVDLLEVRQVLEAKSAREAAVRLSDEELAQLRKLLDEMRANMDSYDAYSRLDVEFHIRLAEYSRNSFLLFLVSSIRESLIELIGELQTNHYQPQRSTIQEFHERIFEALAGRSPDGAEREMNRHFDEILARVREAIGNE
ncbi:MAG: FCD domain-containing protein [Spirochaetes bacterium]|jgi:GntR family transcriptional activator of glc operon|nr:FCD domain-containing protein [Spirochaetota bacterium]